MASVWTSLPLSFVGSDFINKTYFPLKRDYSYNYHHLKCIGRQKQIDKGINPLIQLMR